MTTEWEIHDSCYIHRTTRVRIFCARNDVGGDYFFIEDLGKFATLTDAMEAAA